MTSDERARAFLLRQDSVLTDPDATRVFSQRRLRLLAATLAALSGATWLVNGALNAWFYAGFAQGQLLSLRSWVHAALAAAWILLWLALRRGTWSKSWLSGMDAGAALATSCAFAGMVLLGVPRLRPELVMAMALGHVLVLRAAIVPSTALRTAALGALAESPVMGAGYALHRTATDRADLPAPGSIAASLLVWALMTIATTSVISAVIFGLRQRIRQVSKLGQYALEAKIGEGGMGVVYRARHALLRRPTAVKLLSSTRTTDLQLARFEREVQATARLSHPNIVAIYDYGRSERGLLYYAMEYVDGIDLERLVRAEGALPDGRVLAIVRQAAEALAEAHQAGLVHRDVKPSNIILCRTARHGEQVKLVDFGLVKESTAGNTQQSDIFSLKGTPLYMAPEAIRAPETVDFRSDLYSLGAVGYFLLTGVPVFDAGSALEVYSKHLHEPPTPPSQRLGRPVATALEREILACLHKAPENRPQSADALLERVAEAGPQCEPFTAQDARRWWADRAPEIRRVSSHPSARSPASDRRLVVDAGGRT